MNESSIVIHTDGGARGNPGPGACAFVVSNGEEIIATGSKYLGEVTNNFAEYSGVLLALNWLLESGTIKRGLVINFFLDSELVVNQLNGKYRVKNTSLIKLHEEVRKEIRKNNLEVNFESVPRIKNKKADQLVNEELDKNV